MQDRDDDHRDLHAFGGEASAAPQPALALDEEERLPWLESADDEEDEGGVDTGRLVRFALFGLALLLGILGVLWAVKHHTSEPAAVADGSVIKAPPPYKQAPPKPGGKTYAGTGDSAYVVSEGKTAQAHLGDEKPAVPVASASVTASSGGTTPAPDMSGVGVQVGAYTSQATAEAGWTRLSSGHEVLKSVKHRIVEGSADIGTVYRLQAVTADVSAANALCSQLKAAGVPCQVKH